jgi:two-component system response regulator NreC
VRTPDVRYKVLLERSVAPIRVLVVDDSAQVRADLRAAMALSGWIEVVGEASQGEEGVEAEASLLPDVVVMDLAMPGMNGYEASRRIKCRRPDCRIVALTIHDDANARQGAETAGVDAFVVKGAPLDELLGAIRG